MLSLDNIRVFVRAVELGSFSAAGRSMRLSAAVVSHRIRSLEKALGKAQEQGDEALLAQTNYRLALIYSKQKKWSKAQPYAETADALYRQLQDEAMVSRTARILDSILEQKEKSTGFLS